ncbi:MAG: CpXC domain-containing protein, partial [Anaerolineales bacterium]|nr:CpXC domain-containing protein [Anaerolineales bacterium]
MPKTQINCPQCRQPIVAEVEQLFDVGKDPQVKQNFLSGGFNLANCPHCGYQGMLASPLVYHDLEKELLLTYFPPELALPINEQEKIIGPLINRVVANLPPEKRKGYLFNPKTMLTLQLMLETVLEGEGITKEMIQAQQDRMNLIQRLLGASEDAQVEIIHQEDDRIDDVFFGLLSRLMESAVMDRQEGVAGKLAELEQALVAHSTKGKELKGEAEEIENAMQTIQALGKDLTREKLLDLIVDSPSDTRLRAYSRLARPGLDYTFFQMLSEKVEQAENQEKARLMEIRDKLLVYTR